MGDPWVITSSALFFIPAAVSVFSQSLIVTIIYTNAAIFSTLYHSSSENNYSEMDVIWASLAVFISLVILAIVAMYLPATHWRVWVPLVLGVTAFVIYFVQGQRCTNECTDTDNDNYVLYHSLWHLFVALAGIFLVITPVNLADAVNLTYRDLGLKLFQGKPRVTRRTMPLGMKTVKTYRASAGPPIK